MFRMQALFVAVIASIPGQAFGQVPANRAGDKPSEPSSTRKVPSNPILEALKPDAKSRQSAKPQDSRDYRDERDIRGTREQRAKDDSLKVFGLDYFESSRQIISARKLYLKDLLTRQAAAISSQGPNVAGRPSETGVTRRPTAQSSGASGVVEPRMPTQEEITSVRGLKPSEKLDLLNRKSMHTLTEPEQIKYRLFLYPSSLDPDRAPTDEELLAVSSLTDQQRLDLVIRQRQNTLSNTEKRLYRTYLYPLSTESVDENLLDDPAALLSSAKRKDLLKRDREGRLTTDERRKYKNYLMDPETFEQRLKAEGDSLVPNPLPSGNRDGLRTDPNAAHNSGQVGTTDAFREILDPLSSIFNHVVASPPANYQIAPGDKLTLRYWSPTQETVQAPLTVDSMGGIVLPMAGRVVVRGMSTQQAEAAFRERLKNIIRGVQVSLEISDLHSIRVTVTGESFYPGSYTVPAVATALNLLLATGGPNDEGTLRTVEVRRAGKIVAVLDIYKLLTGGNTTDMPLENDDVLHIPARRTQIAVSGEVRRPALYELLENETLGDALKFAGGVKASGVAQRVQVATVTPGAARVLKDVDIASLPKTTVPVYDGDQVQVFSLRTELANKVSIEGAVDQPGDYELTPGMRISDLVARSRGLLNEAYPTRADLYRYNPDATETLIPVRLDKALGGAADENPVLQKWDRLKVYTVADVSWVGRREVMVKGAVKNPGTYYRADNMRVKDLLLTAGGTTPDAHTSFAALLHRRPDGSFGYHYVDLMKAIAEDPEHNVKLEERDVLAIYRADEAQFMAERTVRVLGEVVSPGAYPRGEAMRLSDVMKLSGGRTPKAGDKALVAHSRVDVGLEPLAVKLDPVSGLPTPDPVLQDGDIITIQGRGEFLERALVINIDGAVNRPGPIILRGNSVRLSEVIRLAGGLKSEAYPEGLEFNRTPDMLATAGQKQTALVIAQLNDLLNQSEYKRELAKSDIDRIKALGKAATESTSVPIGGFGGSVPTPAVPGAGSLFQRDLVTPARALGLNDLTPHGNVVVNLADAMKRPGTADDIIMMDGDQLTVPERPTTVQVIGAVIRPTGILWKQGAAVSYYIENAAGMAPDAATDRVLVIRLNGGMMPAKKVKQLLPGDVILVPTKVLAAKIQARNNELQSIFTSVTNSVLVFFFAKRLLGI